MQHLEALEFSRHRLGLFYKAKCIRVSREAGVKF